MIGGGTLFPYIDLSQTAMGKEIRFPVLNAEYLSECPCLCPGCSPKPPPSFPLRLFKVEDVGGTIAPVMAHILLCYSLPMVEAFPFPDVSASCTRAVKNIWSLNTCRDEAILNLFCPLLYPLNLRLPSSLKIWKLRPMSS